MFCSSRMRLSNAFSAYIIFVQQLLFDSERLGKNTCSADVHHSSCLPCRFNVYVAQPEVKPGCVLRRSNVRVLESRKLVSNDEARGHLPVCELWSCHCPLSTCQSHGLINSLWCAVQVQSCKRNMNTFAFVGDLDKSPEVSCVYHSEDAENAFLKDPKTARLGDGYRARPGFETSSEPSPAATNGAS